jgi:F0F1-type ATP synthase gamma subunit
MRRPLEIKANVTTMDTLVTLTSAFEGIASAHLARIRSEVLQSNAFFEDIFQIYSKIRVDKVFHFGRVDSSKVLIDKELYILITAEGGFSGDIGDYKNAMVFYPKYLTLSTQEITSVQLSAVVQEMSQGIQINDEIISQFNYIFEPSIRDVVSHMERSMLFISISQFILDSKLAQYASRFRAMSMAHHTALDSRDDYQVQYHRAIRGLQDERLKETINSLRKIRAKV